MSALSPRPHQQFSTASSDCGSSRRSPLLLPMYLPRCMRRITALSDHLINHCSVDRDGLDSGSGSMNCILCDDKSVKCDWQHLNPFLFWTPMRFYACAVYSIWFVELVSSTTRKRFHEQDIYIYIYSYRGRCVQSFILRSLHAISWLSFYLTSHLSTIRSSESTNCPAVFQKVVIIEGYDGIREHAKDIAMGNSFILKVTVSFWNAKYFFPLKFQKYLIIKIFNGHKNIRNKIEHHHHHIVI